MGGFFRGVGWNGTDCGGWGLALSSYCFIALLAKPATWVTPLSSPFSFQQLLGVSAAF